MEASRTTTTSSRSNSYDLTSKLKVLARVLDAERERGFPDRAVMGGLGKFVAGLISSDAGGTLSPEIKALEAYEGMDASTRAAAVAEAMQSLGERTEQPQRKAPRRKKKRVTGVGLESPVTDLFRVGPQYEKLLKKLGIDTYRDMLFHFPRRYLDRSTFTPISDVEPGDAVNVIADVIEIVSRKSPQRRFTLTEALLSDESGDIKAIWFNQPYVAKSLRNKKGVAFFGRATWGDLGPELRAPEYELDLGRSLHSGRQVPVYRSTGKLSQKLLRLWASQAVEACAALVDEFLPERILESAGLIGIEEALRSIHFPETPEDAVRAVKRLAFDELFLLQLGVLERRRDWREGSPGKAVTVERDDVRSFVRSLGFALTGDQKQAVAEILDDIERPIAMNRLLQGDVGSGKTVVAASALLAAALAGAQSAFMAPTQILAEQHFKTLTDLMSSYGLEAALITGALTKARRRKAWERVENGEVQIVVGTHALIADEARFRDLNLVIVDEQHRFGVHQRARLRGKGFNPHMLVMTATPIPRTLALTLYGDLDITRISEMPPGRTPVKTALISPETRTKAYRFVREQLAAGWQAFAVYPVIDESETLQVRAAEREFERLREEVFPEFGDGIALLHGRMSNKRKTETMIRLRNGEIKLLVSTALVEVGVDVPNATVMIIEGAERFGLAQLHQFRGRVGRSDQQSYCLLFSDSTDAAENERLQAMTRSGDGFALAEKDLEIRGPGEILGSRQSGLPVLKVASLSDVDTLELARREAVALFKRDGYLKDPENAGVAERLANFWDSLAELS
ncbi:MAG: ATP-dependent DNA helicase RecG [Chloroflexi bacterium]|nr:ATP-dependent DNA helicase RecG [Chloroflexota bacterium]